MISDNDSPKRRVPRALRIRDQYGHTHRVPIVTARDLERRDSMPSEPPSTMARVVGTTATALFGIILIVVLLVVLAAATWALLNLLGLISNMLNTFGAV